MRRGAHQTGTATHLVRAAAFAAASMLLGCQTEEKVVRYRPILAAAPGAVSATKPVGPRFEGEYIDPTASRDSSGAPAPLELDEQGRAKMYVEMPDGSKRLLTPSGRHLMSHIVNTIDDDDRDLFLEQVLSKITREEFVRRGLDPGLAFTELRRRRADILRLFDAMPNGEFTPGMLMRNVGNGVQRLRVSGPKASELRWTFMDMRFEDGQWRLRWFGPN